MAQVERAENLAPETEKLDRKSVKGRMQDNKTVTDIANQLRTTRQAFINRVQLTKEIPLPEKHPFIQKAERAKQEEDLFQVQKEFDRHLEESRKRIEAVHKIIDEHRDILRRGEDQELLTNVMQMTFEQKQKAVTEIDRMLAEREKMMEGTKGLDKKQQEALGKDMEKLSPKERLAKLKDIEKTNKLFQSYKKLWEKHWDKISEQTIAEFCEWFLNDVPPHRQEWALQKAEKEDILPRVKLFDIHAKLPSEYQAKDFKEMGLTERKNYLLQAERRLDNDYAKLLWSPQIDMSDDSKRFAERSFTALKGTEKLLLKAEFFQNFPEQAKTEARLREQLQRYPQKLWQPLAEKFNKSKFEGKVQIIQQVGKLDHEYQVLRREMTSLSPKVRAHYEEKFEGADSFDAMKALLKKGKEFSRFRDKYFKLLDENEHHFSADPSFRERLYDEKVTNLEQAKKRMKN